MTDKTKKCCACKETKFLESFHKNKSTKDGRASECKQCRSTLKKLNAPESSGQPLTDQYIRMLLYSDIKNLIIKIPYELIELKREEIRIKRELLRNDNGKKSN